MAAIQQVLMMSGALVTLPEDNFLIGDVNSSSAQITPSEGPNAQAIASITITPQGTLVLLFSGAGDSTEIGGINSSTTWLQGGYASVFSAKMTGTIFGDAGNPATYESLNTWIPISTSRTWGVTAFRSGAQPGDISRNLQAVLEISYTSDPSKRVIANTNVNLSVSAQVIGF